MVKNNVEFGLNTIALSDWVILFLTMVSNVGISAFNFKQIANIKKTMYLILLTIRLGPVEI